MDWMPLLLCLTSGAIVLPLLRKFQHQMDALSKKMREGEAQIRECETSIRKMHAEEEKIKGDCEKADRELAELDQERAKQERLLLQAKTRPTDGDEIESKHV